MFGLGGAWCPVELYAHSTHWFPFTHHGHIKTGDGHQTREQGRGKPWYEVKSGQSTGTGYTGRKVCPSSRRTCTQLALPPSSSCQHLPCPTPSFSLFPHSEQQTKEAWLKAEHNAHYLHPCDKFNDWLDFNNLGFSKKQSIVIYHSDKITHQFFCIKNHTYSYLTLLDNIIYTLYQFLWYCLY